MNNFKTSIFILFIIILSVSLIGCNSKGDENNITNSSGLEEASTENIINGVENKIKKVVSGFEYGKIDELNIYEDPLLMERGRNKKKYNNIIVEVTLELSNDFDIRDTDKVIRDYSDAITQEFQSINDEYDFDEMLEKGYFRIQGISIDYRRENQTGLPMGGKGTRFSFSDIKGDVTLFELDQDKEDFKAQSLVYKHLEKDKEIDLQRIGIEDNNFIIQLKVFEFQEDGYQSKIRPISDDLAKLILEDDEIKRYLIDKSVKDINVYWDMMWYQGNEPLEYNYKIN